MRFYDDVMRDKSIPHAVKDLLDGAVVVVCDNVARYYYCDTDKEYWDLQDFPNIAPPWGRFWLDFKAPPYIVSEEYGGRIPWGSEKPTMWGLHCQATEDSTGAWIETPEGREIITRNIQANMQIITEDIERKLPGGMAGLARMSKQEIEVLPDRLYASAVQVLNMRDVLAQIARGDTSACKRVWGTADGGYKWIMDVTLFQRGTFASKDRIFGPLWTWRLFIDERGECVKSPLQQHLVLVRSHEETDKMIAMLRREGVSATDTWQTVVQSLTPFLHTALLSISFLHCRNVALSETRPPKHIIRNKGARRRGEQDYQPVTFKTLDIRPMKEVLKQAGAGAPPGSHTTRALHIARGHFHHYTGDSKLFGKYNGTFWIPQHVRGGAQGRITVKDYRIKV